MVDPMREVIVRIQLSDSLGWSMKRWDASSSDAESLGITRERVDKFQSRGEDENYATRCGLTFPDFFEDEEMRELRLVPAQKLCDYDSQVRSARHMPEHKAI